MKAKTLFKYSALFIVLLALQSTKLFSADSTLYYKGKFVEWGLRTDLFDARSLSILKSPKREYLMLLSSSISQYQQNINIDRHTKIILIVDSDFSLEDKLSCTKFYCDAKNSSEIHSISLGTSYLGRVAQVISTKIADKSALVVPEQFLLVPEISRNLELLIKAIPGDSDSNILVKVDPNTQISLLRSFVLSTAGRLFIGLPVVLVVFTFLYFISKHLKITSSANTNETWFYAAVKSSYDLLDMSKQRLLIIFVLMTMPIATGFMYFFNRTSSVTEAIKSILPIFTAFSIVPPVSRAIFISDILIIFLTAYLLLWLTLCTLYIFPFIRSLAINKFLDELKRSAVEKLYLTSLILLVFLSLVIDNKIFVAPFICLVLVLFVLTIYFRKSEITLLKRTPIRRRIGYIFAMAFTLLLCYQARPLISDKVRYSWISLTAASDKYIALPLVLPLDRQTRFKDIFIPTSNSILVGDYMVVSPISSTIVNESIVDFHDVSNFLILSTDREQYINTLPKLQKNLELFKTASLTSYFSINDSNATDITLTLFFDCSKGLDALIVTLNSYSLDSVSPYKNAISKKILNFPGCNKDARELYFTYTVPLPKAFRPGDNFVFELVDREKAGVIDYRLQSNSGPLVITNHKDPENSKVLYDSASKSVTNEPLTVFSFGITTRAEFDRTGDSVNLAKIINDLTQKNIVKDKLVIWSLEDFATINLDSVAR